MATLPLSNEHLQKLKHFIELCDSQPSIINHPKLSFFKNFIEKFGGKIPKQDEDNKSTSESCDKAPDSENESDLELDMTGVIEPDNDSPQPMGDYNMEPTDEQIEESNEKRFSAADAFREKDYEKAIQLYTEAILLNPGLPLSYVKRGQVYLILEKPNACIRDCTRAIELNPDSAAAHKFRGRANQLLGKWEDAAMDLRKACQFDFDEEADKWLKEVTPNARKIEEHKRKKERLRLEREARERKEERQQKERETKTKAQADESEPQRPDANKIRQFFEDIEVVEAFQDKEVAEALEDISNNPASIFKYQNNPKIMELVSKAAKKFGANADLGKFWSGMPDIAGMAGMGAGAAPPPPKPNDDDDFGLD